MTQSQTWFPGRDYPDREMWLLKRYTPRVVDTTEPVYLHRGANENGVTPPGVPMKLGINVTKRRAGHRKGYAHSAMVHARHRMYLERAA